MIEKDKEFSKRQVRWTFLAFWVQVFLTMIGVVFVPDAAKPLTDILTATATLAGAVHVGYFGKAGMENYKKITAGTRGENEEDE